MTLKKDVIHQITKLIDQKEWIKKVIVLMKDELGGKIVIDFVPLRPKTYSYLTDNDNYVKKLKK